MGIKNKFYFNVIAAAYFVAVLFVLVAPANAAQEMKSPVEEEIAGPGRYQTEITSLEPWLVDGKTVGVVASYKFKDVAADRPADYWEFYDGDGHLLAIIWFDQFGIRRIAIDEGILEKKGSFEGIFVLVVNGDTF